MKILIQGAQILDSTSSFNRKKINVLVADGRISQIGDKKYSADRTLSAEGMILTQGWFDMGTFVGDPGLEQKEDLESVARAAMAGGFTEIAVLPNTHPPIQTKNDISYLQRGNDKSLVQVHPLASVTRDNKGEELTEMIDLHAAGAVAFTDGLRPVWHTDVFLKSLQYLRRFDGLLIERPEDFWLNMFGQMHEGAVSTALGLKGMPGIAEEIMINRDLQLLAYAGGRLHFSRLSTAKSVSIIRSARKRMAVSCDVASYQPILGDDALTEFDTSYKVNPPLREKSDREALIRGLIDDTIDVICSGHLPHDEEAKNLEFDLAEFGMTSLQTLGPNLVELSEKVKWSGLVDKVTRNPRTLLGLPVPTIEVGAPANLTLFDPKRKWRLDERTNFSRSRNSPWFGKELTGGVVAVFNNDQHHFAE